MRVKNKVILVTGSTTGIGEAIARLAVREGAQVISVPVRHRPRTQGKSKYGVHNRLWVGIVDLFGVIWLQRRMTHPQVEP